MPFLNLRSAVWCAASLTAFVLSPGLQPKTASALEFRVVATDAKGNCRLAEIVIDGILVGHALERRDGRLNSLFPGTYRATARFFPPDLLLILLPGHPVDQAIRLRLTRENTSNSARLAAERYLAADGRGLPYELSVATSVNPENCTSMVSAIAGPSTDNWRNSILFRQLYQDAEGDVFGSYSGSIDFTLSRPESIEFRSGNRAFRRAGVRWQELYGDEIVAEYDEFDRNLAGFDVRDVKNSVIEIFGVATEVPRIVHIPSGFRFWLPDSGPARTAITVYRPNYRLLLSASREDHQHQAQSVVITSKSFIKKILIDEIVPGDALSASNADRLGFSDMTAQRLEALEFAILLDTLMSEDPSSRSSATGDYRLWSELQVHGLCSTDTLLSYFVQLPSTRFGTELGLETSGTLVQPLSISPTASGGATQTLKVAFEVRGRPNVAALPSFNLIRPRTCTWIWHRVSVEVKCELGNLTATGSIQGSKFPSHRLWIGENVSMSIEQGPFESLWVCQATDPSIVE